MSKRMKWFAALVLLQTLALLGLAGAAYGVHQFGREVRLQTVPVDPRDALYGDYVTLSYEMSRLAPSLWRGEALPGEGDAVYVVLEPQAGVHVPVAAYPHRAALSAEQVQIKGIVQYRWNDDIAVRYGLERYYVPEGAGLELERQAGDLIVVARVSPWGHAVLSDALTKN